MTPLHAQLLVVDASAETAESLQILLETLGYGVHVALDGASATAVVERHPIDLAFIAIALPDVDGYTLARRLRGGTRRIALIALTGYGHADDRRRALESGFDEHLLKPASLEELQGVLARFVMGEPR